MRIFTRGLAAIATATALTLSGTAVATAQSSMSSFPLSSSSDAPANPHADAEASIKGAIENYFLAAGHQKSPSSEETAEVWLNQALRKELTYVNDLSWGTSWDGHYGFVVRTPLAEVDQVVENIKATDVAEDIVSAPFGVAVGSDEEYIYTAVVVRG